MRLGTMHLYERYAKFRERRCSEKEWKWFRRRVKASGKHVLEKAQMGLRQLRSKDKLVGSIKAQQ